MTDCLSELYRVYQKSGTLDFRYFDIRKYNIILISSDKTLFSEQNDTKIIRFGSVSIDSTTISSNTVIYEFCLICTTYVSSDKHPVVASWVRSLCDIAL